MEKISDTILNLTELNKKSLDKAFLTLLLEWKHFENHLDLIQKCYKHLNSRENHLQAIQESVTQSSIELDLIRKSLEKRFEQLEEKEKEFILFQENGMREFDLREEKLGLISNDVKMREERMDVQEKWMEKLLEEIKMHRDGFERVRKKVDDGVKEMEVKQKCILDRFREREFKAKAFTECVKDDQFKGMSVKAFVGCVEQDGFEEMTMKQKCNEDRFRENSCKAKAFAGCAEEDGFEEEKKKMDAFEKEIELRKMDLSRTEELKPIDYEMGDASNANVVDVVDLSSGSESAGSKRRGRKKRFTSKAWKHFTKLKKEDGTTPDQCKCNYCDKIFPCSSKRHGTSALLSHINRGKCPAYLRRTKGLQTSDVQDEELPMKRGDAQNARQSQLSDQKLHRNDQSESSVDQQLILFEAERNSGDVRCKSRKRVRKHVVISDEESSDTSDLSDTGYFRGYSRRSLRNKSSEESYERHGIVKYNDDPVYGFIICSPLE